MKMVYGLLVIAVVMLHCGTCRAQDVRFSQFYSNLVYLNPAFAGNTLHRRLATSYRNQWPSVPEAFVSYSASLDQSIPALNSGNGILLLHDRSGMGGLRQTTVGGLWSTYVRIQNNKFLRAGTQLSFTTRKLNVQDMTFGDQLLRNDGSASYDVLPLTTRSYVNMDFGLLYYSKALWLGIAGHHLNKPNASFFREGGELPVKLSIHSGYKFTIFTNIDGVVTQSGMLVSSYQHEGGADQWEAGMLWINDPIVLGVSYRGISIVKALDPQFSNRDALVFMFGVKVDRMKFSYSYDATMSRLTSHTGGAHEISLSMEYVSLSRINKDVTHILIPCSQY